MFGYERVEEERSGMVFVSLAVLKRYRASPRKRQVSRVKAQTWAAHLLQVTRMDSWLYPAIRWYRRSFHSG